MQSNSSSLVHHQDNMNAGAAIHRMEFQPPVPTCTLRYANVYNLGGKGGGGGERTFVSVIKFHIIKSADAKPIAYFPVTNSP